jgi:hypothetical protein
MSKLLVVFEDDSKPASLSLPCYRWSLRCFIFLHYGALLIQKQYAVNTPQYVLYFFIGTLGAEYTALHTHNIIAGDVSRTKQACDKDPRNDL